MHCPRRRRRPSRQSSRLRTAPRPLARPDSTLGHSTTAYACFPISCQRHSTGGPTPSQTRPSWSCPRYALPRPRAAAHMSRCTAAYTPPECGSRTKSELPRTRCCLSPRWRDRRADLASDVAHTASQIQMLTRRRSRGSWVAPGIWAWRHISFQPSAGCRVPRSLRQAG